MQERDTYQGDYSRRYYPKSDLLEYLKYTDLMKGKPRYMSTMNKQQLEKFRDVMSFNGTLSVAVLGVSLLPVIFFRKLPWFKTFRSTTGRVLWSIAFLMVPSIIANFYQNNVWIKFIQRRYGLRGDDFTRYKQTGDILKVNEDIRLVES